MDIETNISILTTLIALFSAVLLYKTIKSNQDLNKKILFSNITKEERELRLKLEKYRERIDNKKLTKHEREIAALNYDTMLFNYYEYLAISLYKGLVNESETKLYFKELLISVKDYFDSSILFEENYAQKKEYKALQWLFKRWKIEY
ncbi:MAG: hypothetical protein KKG75_04455 [Nanoarchaeota archaeon]|nr:hypothetical protein [Nanoarchaeota archaeon]